MQFFLVAQVNFAFIELIVFIPIQGCCMIRKMSKAPGMEGQELAIHEGRLEKAGSHKKSQSKKLPLVKLLSFPQSSGSIQYCTFIRIPIR